MTTNSHDDAVLERNVETLLESGGEPPVMTDIARARIRSALIARHGVDAAKRSARAPIAAIAIGLAATAAAALIITRFVGNDDGNGAATTGTVHKLADGSSWITAPGGTVTPLGDRRVRVDGAALLDVAPGKGTFVVETARGTIHVIGTRFLVDAERNRTTTAVVRGVVKLATDAGDVVLHAGEQAVAEPGKPPVRGPAPRLSHLVSWAAQARRKDEKDTSPLRTGTLFARDPSIRGTQMGAEQPLPLKKLGIDIVVENLVARVALDQTFHNPHPQVLEGVYKFAIPPDAALQRLAMYVDGVLTESAVVERMRARRIYEELVYRRVDPALLEWAGTGRLNLRVYPLPAHQDKRLVLAYTQSLAKLYGDWSISVPLPEIDKPVGELAIDVTVRGCATCELTSTSHPITVATKGEDAVVTYRKTGAKIGDSLVLHVREAAQTTRVAMHADGGDRYLMVRAGADLPRAPRTYRPRTWVILDDVSASRSAMERRAQADLVDAFVQELDEEDRLAVIAFDVRAREKLAPTRVLDVDRQKLRASLKGEGDVGATDFAVALDAATKLLAGVAPEDAMIVYLGDGVITSGARNLDALTQRVRGKAQFVGVGVGDGPDTQSLEALAAATGGYATTIDLAEDVGWRAFDLVAALHTARVTGVEAALVDDKGAPVPATLYLRSPQLADGEELELVAKLRGGATPASLALTGTLDGARWTRTIDLRPGATAGDHGYLPRLWAQRHVAARLLEKHQPVAVPPCVEAASCPTEAQARQQRDEQIRQEVVALGKQYFLLSRHTSLIVLENDAMYAQYGVRKGSGDTWAPYAVPDRIPVITTAPAVPPSDVADDATLVRTPLQVFVAPYAGDEEWNIQGGGWGTIGTGRFGTIGHGSGTGSGYGVGSGRGGGGTSRVDLGLVTTTPATSQPAPVATPAAEPKPDVTGADKTLALELGKSANAEPGWLGNDDAEQRTERKRATVTSGEMSRSTTTRGPVDGLRDRRGWWGASANLQAQRLTYPTDQAYDDLTAFIPALVPDDSDRWRDELEAVRAPAPRTIDDAARRMLAEARDALPSGVYRWGDREIAVDSQHRLGWKRTTETDLVETASFDGTTLTRRYGELGLDVTRRIGDDDVALALGYLPIWIADPAHYARYFETRATNDREITLSVPGAPGAKPTVVFVLELDARRRLVAIRDAAGGELVRVTWSDAGPTGARVLGADIRVGFTPQPIVDAAMWAHAAPAPAVVVELPMRVPQYWRTKVAAETAGTPAWRHAQRQLLASLAAVNDRQAQFVTYEQLRAAGGISVGEVVLASGGLASAFTSLQLERALAPVSSELVARYLTAGRAFAENQRPERMRAVQATGLVGALWQLREITALVYAGQAVPAIDRLVALGDRAVMFRAIAAATTAVRYDLDATQIARAWDTVAVGAYRNVAHAAAAQAMMNRGAYDAAADRLARLADEYDATALPPTLGYLVTQVQSSRRGVAGMQLVWSQLRNKVLATNAYDHVIALVGPTAQQAGDLLTILNRASDLAGTDVERKVAVARLAMQYGQQAFARATIEPLLQARGTRELYLLAAQLAQAAGQPAKTLEYLEAAQDAGADEAVEISTVRAEMTRILQAARSVALASWDRSNRHPAVERAKMWAARWRAIDPANPEIDRQIGELLLAVGDHDEAWRQLSSMIERDPMAGTGYVAVAEAFERQGKVAEALAFWDQAIVIDQTNPTHRLRKAQALIALGRTADGDALLREIANGKWHAMWSSVTYQAKYLLERAKPQTR